MMFRALCILLIPQLVMAQEINSWPQWRGSTGTGVTAEKNWKSKFDDDTPPKLWDAKVGRGSRLPSFAMDACTSLQPIRRA